MNVAHLVLERSKVIVFVVLVLAAFGVRSYLIAPQSIFPAMSFARIDVVADAGDLTPERVRVAVTRPLETALGTLPSATAFVRTRRRARARSSSISTRVRIPASICNTRRRRSHRSHLRCPPRSVSSR